MKKIISLMLAGLLSLFCCIGTGAALPETAVPLWDNITTIYFDMSFTGNRGCADTTIAAKTGTTEITGTLIVHERTTYGWRQVDSVTKTVTDQAMALTISFDGIPGVEYRAVYNYSVTRNGIVETEVDSIYVTC